MPLWLARKIEFDRMERLKARVLLEVGADLPEASPGMNTPGDARQLRGIPVVGVSGGMGGAMAGTRPGDNL
jgi:hypothetical protein